MPARQRRAVLGAVLAVLAAAALVPAVSHWAAGSEGSGGAGSAWRASWRDAPQPPAATGVSHDGFANETIRMIVRLSVGGQEVRLRLSNAYGQNSLTIGAVSVAAQQNGPITVARTQKSVTFTGSRSVTIAPGSEAVSDPVPVPIRAGQHLLVSLYLPAATGPATWHTKAQATTYLSGSGDWADEPGGSPFQSITTSWFFLDGVDVLARPLAGTVVAFGDSITDGSFSTLDADQTYPDWLSRRASDLAVLNEGIGGNELLTDTPGGGASALHRFQRDAIDQPGVTGIVLLEGVNDIGKGATSQQVIDAVSELVQQAHTHCITVIGATITPFQGSVYDTPAHEAAREAVNDWIRTSGTFDGVADFDKALRDPADPFEIDPRYHTVGDLHPNDLGYRVMAETVDLAQLRPRPGCEAP